VRPGRTAGVSKSPLRVFSHGKFGPLCFVRTSCYSLGVGNSLIYVRQSRAASIEHARERILYTYLCIRLINCPSIKS